MASIFGALQGMFLPFPKCSKIQGDERERHRVLSRPALCLHVGDCQAFRAGHERSRPAGSGIENFKLPSAASTLRESTIAIAVSLRSAMKMFNFPWLRLPEGSETLQGEIRKVFFEPHCSETPPQPLRRNQVKQKKTHDLIGTYFVLSRCESLATMII